MGFYHTARVPPPQYFDAPRSRRPVADATFKKSENELNIRNADLAMEGGAYRPPCPPRIKEQLAYLTNKEFVEVVASATVLRRFKEINATRALHV